MRIVFFGTPAFAVPSLDALLTAGHQVHLVVTQPDRPAGRGRQLTSPPVALFARQHDLPLWQTARVRGAEAEATLRAVDAEAMVLAAFAAWLPDNLLTLVPAGILNVHPSLLPRWRGASPIQSALLAGDAETGVSVIRLVHDLDAGPILGQVRSAIDPRDDYLTLEDRLSRLGARLLVDTLEALRRQTIVDQPQDDSTATHCARISRADALLDWQQSGELLGRAVRAYRGWPQAYTCWEGKVLKILRAAPVPDVSATPGKVLSDAPDLLVGTGHGALRLDQVVLQGSRLQSGAEFLRGHPALTGALLGQ